MIGTGRRRPEASGSPELVADQLDRHHMAVLVADHAGRRDHVLDLDALDLGLFELELLDRDLVDGTAIGHHRALGAQAEDGAHAVHRGEPTTDGDDATADPDIFLAEGDVCQELQAGNDAFEMVARDAEGLRGLAAGREDHDIMRVDDLLQLDVLADLGVVVDLHAEIGDEGDFLGDDIAREAPLRHARPHHAARDREALVDLDGVPAASELAGRGQAGDARADDADRHAVRRAGDIAAGITTVVGGDALEVADADRGVDFLAAAGVLTGAGAHAAEAAREDVVLAVQLVAVRVAAVGDEGDVAGNVRVRRAGRHARDVVGEPLRIAGRPAGSACRHGS